MEQQHKQQSLLFHSYLANVGSEDDSCGERVLDSKPEYADKGLILVIFISTLVGFMTSCLASVYST